MLIQAKIVEAGPRGNSCKKCKLKIKKPDLIIKANGEFNRFSGHQKIDNYCTKCGLMAIDISISTLKEFRSILLQGNINTNTTSEKTKVI